MKEWFKRQSPSIKVMMLLIGTSILGIVVNWENVSGGVYEAINSRIETIMDDTK